MSTKPNPSIGSCPCPRSGCKQICTVKKFAQRSVTDNGRRNAGKLYIDCPDDGRFGFDGKPGMQDWILEHATLDGEAPRKSAPPAAATAQKPPQASAPSRAVGSAPPAEKHAKKQPEERGGFTLLG